MIFECFLLDCERSGFESQAVLLKSRVALDKSPTLSFKIPSVKGEG